MLREDEYLDAWKTAANRPGRFQAIQVGHAYIHNDQVGMKLVGLLDGILPIHGFATNLTSLLRSEERTYAPADHFMIIGNQNSHSGLPSIFDTRKLRLSSKHHD
jgi:hypothetical protein